MLLESTAKLDLSSGEMEYIRNQLGREPNAVEWGMLDTMYSEHCSYKSSRRLLKQLHFSNSAVVAGPGYDCGLVDVGDGFAVGFKVESHNHPSALDPYNGAATGIGGIVRDILAVGARPIGLLDLLRFGSLSSAHSRWLLDYVVRGIADYGNCIGVPTVAGDVEFDDSFGVNCLVNVGCLGVVRKDRILLGALRRPGDLLLLVGGSTGRDGIHGVTFASRTLTSESEQDRPAVQIGDPFTKKIMIEAVLEALDTRRISAMKDLGGGGLTCAVSEMCAKGGTGAELDLDRIRMREDGMTPYEILLSESQERMLLAVDPAGLEAVCEPFRKFEVSHSVVGRVTDSKRLVARWKGQVVVDLPAALITSCPEPPRFALRPRYVEELRNLRLPREPSNLTDAVLKVVSSPNLASKEWIYRQYDHEVGIATVLKPGDGDAAVLRILETNRGVAVKGDCNTLHSHLDPFRGAAGALVETVRNVVAVGGRPLAYTDGCNFGNPEKPDVFWQFSEAIRGLVYASKGLNVPCVGGNVSFYNEDEETGQSVKPVTIVITVGVIDDLDHATSMALKTTRGATLVLGETLPELGGTEYLRAVHGLVQGSPPKVHLRQERAAHTVVAEAINAGLVEAVHDCSKGGLAAALALMAVKGRRGLSVELKRVPQWGVRRTDELLFSESHGRFIVETSNEDSKRVLKIAKRVRCPAAVVGRTLDSETFAITRQGKPVVECSMKELERGWSRTLPEVMGDM